MTITFYLLNESDGSIRCPLPEHAGFTVSPIANSPGSIELSYPRGGRFYDLLTEHLDAETDAPIEMWVRGSREGARQGLLLDYDGDEAKRNNVGTFVGAFDEFRLTDAVVKPGTGETSPDPDAEPDADAKFYAATPGRIMATLLQDAQARGTLTALSWSFTEAVDSRGEPWAKDQTLKFSPGITYLEVAEALVEYGLAEFDVRDREVRLFNFGSRGRDLTLGAAPVRFIRGRDVRDAPRRRTIRDSVTDLLLSGSDGLYVELNDPAARARRGRQREGYRSQGSLNTTAGLTAYGQVELERAVAAVDERTHGLAFKAGSPVPLVDFEDGDWVWSKMGSGMRRLRIRQLTISEDESRTREGSVTLNDLIAERDAKLARRIKGIEGGTTITGTSQARPVDQEEDTTPPAAPLGLTADSEANTATDGSTSAVLYASWAAVTTDAGGGATTDVRGYQLQYRYLADDVPGEWISTGEVDDPATDVGGLLTDQPVELRVRAVDTAGNASAWSVSEFVTTAFDAAAPGVPSAPIASNYIGILAVEVDGLTEAGIPVRDAAPDYDHTNLYIDTASGFDPLLGEGELIGSVRTASTFGYDKGVPGVTLFVRCTNVDRSGNESTASVESSATPGLVEEGDVGSVSIGSLTAGILRALMIVADGQIVTSEGPDGVKIDNDGFRCLTLAGVPVLAFSIATGLLELIGKFSTSEAGGARIEIDPEGPDGNPTMSLFSDDGLFGGARLNAFAVAGGQTGLGINSGEDSSGQYFRVLLQPEYAELRAIDGVSSGVTLDAQTGTSQLIGNSGQLELQGDGDILLYRNVDGDLRVNELFVYNNGIYLNAYDTNGDRQAYVGAQSDGKINIFGSASTKLTMDNDGTVILGGQNQGFVRINPGGSVEVVSNGTLKSFVIDHPTDPDRWLVHGCTESPNAGVEYWGEARVQGGTAEVELPGYFEAATRPDGRQVQLTPVLVDAAAAVPVAAATRITDGRFRIACDAPDGTPVGWLVKATRADVAPFDAEPRRADVSVGGTGPYRFIAPRPRPLEDPA